MSPSARQFSAHAAHEGRHREHQVEGCTFEEAAIAFVETWHPTVDAQGDVSIIVREAESGHEQCFRIDVESSEAAPCD